MMAAGFLGAAVLLVVANVLGLVGGGQSNAAVKGAYAAFKTTGLTPQQIYQQHVGSVVWADRPTPSPAMPPGDRDPAPSLPR